MFVCDTCGYVADDLFHYREWHGDEFWEEWADANCPECGDGEMVEGFTCTKCGWDFPENRLHYGICEDCLLDMAEDFPLMVEWLDALNDEFYCAWIFDTYTDNRALIGIARDHFWARSEDDKVRLIKEFIADDIDPLAYYVTEIRRKGRRAV